MSLILAGDPGGNVEAAMVSSGEGKVARCEETSLMRLQEWVLNGYKNVSALIQTDVRGSPYLRVAKTSPHPVLVTQPSLTLLCRVDTASQFVCLVQSFNMISIKEVHASFEDEKVEENR